MKVFKEEQRFTQTWIVVLIVLSVLIPLVVISNYYLEEDSSISSTEYFLTLGGAVLVSSVIFLFKLTTRIDEKGIHYQFFPFHLKLKTIAWTEIESAYVRKYDAISEYGGWGLRSGMFWKRSKGTAINVSGNYGIQLELKNGKKILIGTQLDNQAKQVINHYNPKLKHHENTI